MHNIARVDCITRHPAHACQGCLRGVLLTRPVRANPEVGSPLGNGLEMQHEQPQGLTPVHAAAIKATCPATLQISHWRDGLLVTVNMKGPNLWTSTVKRAPTCDVASSSTDRRWIGDWTKRL